MSSSAHPTSNEDENAPEQSDATKTEESLPESAGGTEKPRRMAVHSKQLQEVLDSTQFDRDGGRAALAATMKEMREKRKKEKGVKTLEGSQTAKTDSKDSGFKQAFYG